MTEKIIYFKQTNGYFRYGKHAGEAVHFKDGVHETNSPVVLEAAEKELRAGGIVDAIADKNPPRMPETLVVPKPEPKFCSRCRVNVDAADWVEHVAGHGRHKKA